MTELPTYEQASRCPRCDMPGLKVSEQVVPSRPGVRIHVFRCMTGGCVFEGLNYLVQVNPDGSVPPPLQHNPDDKLYPNPEKFATEESRRNRIMQSLQHQREQEMRKGTEVRNPRAPR